MDKFIDNYIFAFSLSCCLCALRVGLFID